jgi:ADP-ribose pyrophosphatase YjhB (NUDIX family)
MTEPDWLRWARELQAIAQNGLAFTPGKFDRERYEQLRAIASRMQAAYTGAPPERIEGLFATERGYATPKIDVRGAVFDAAGRILLVREIADQDRWTLPGGWADVNLTAAENTVKEVREESGLDVRARKLVAVWDRTRQGHPPSAFAAAKFFFLCEVISGVAAPGLETSAVGWFGEHELPSDLSLGRVLPHQLRRMFAHARDPGLPTEFE